MPDSSPASNEIRAAETPGVLAHPAVVAVLARDKASLRTLANDPGWRTLATRPAQRVWIWSDDYVNMLSALR